jgi:hypothetical protein
MKKSLCFYAACLILGVGLVVAELPINFAWATAVGDCEQATSEAYSYCAAKANCTSGGCKLGGISGYPDVGAVVDTDIRKTGTCVISTSNQSSCVKCKKFYCTNRVGYESMDAQGQCQNEKVSALMYVENQCI